MEQIVHFPVPQVVEEIAGVVQIILQERVSKSIIDQIVDVPVAMQRQVPTIQTFQKTLEVPQMQTFDREVEVLVVMQRQVPKRRRGHALLFDEGDTSAMSECETAGCSFEACSQHVNCRVEYRREQFLRRLTTCVA